MEQVNLSIEATGFGFGILILAFIVIHVVLVNKYRHREKVSEQQVYNTTMKYVKMKDENEKVVMRMEELRVALANKQDENEALKARIEKFEMERCRDTGRFIGKRNRKQTNK